MPTQSMNNGQVDKMEPLGYVLHYTLTLILLSLLKTSFQLPHLYQRYYALDYRTSTVRLSLHTPSCNKGSVGPGRHFESTSVFVCLIMLSNEVQHVGACSMSPCFPDGHGLHSQNDG